MPLPDLPPFLTRWPDGEVVVAGTRVLLFYVVLNYKDGESVESLGVRYPHIPLATLHKVIAFYLENQSEVDEFVNGYQADLDGLRAAGPVLDLSALRERIHQRSQSKSPS
jgi:uncharacterized protein (DUF433 family)